MAVKLIIDAACDLSMEQAKEMGVILIPMTIRFGEQEYQSGVNITSEEFYHKLTSSKELPTTSQPSPWVFEEAFQRIVDNGDEAVVLCVSSALSGTYQSACIAADGFDGKICVVDTRTVSIGQRILLEYALTLPYQGYSAREIAAILDNKKKDIYVCGAVETLEYLIKGGRLSKTAGAVGTMMGIRPVLHLVEGALAVFGKARGPKAAIAMVHNLIEKAGVDLSLSFGVGYTGSDPHAVAPFLEVSEASWGGHRVPVYPVGSTVGTHTGPGLFLAAFFKKS